jgi:predicted DNA-binding transcriptional regulator AlpA
MNPPLNDQSNPPLEPLLSIADLVRVLNASRRVVERLKSAGKLPRPDLIIGRMPRWRPDTIRQWIEQGGKP